VGSGERLGMTGGTKVSVRERGSCGWVSPGLLGWLTQVGPVAAFSSLFSSLLFIFCFKFCVV
jgi:hypothetical protein